MYLMVIHGDVYISHLVAAICVIAFIIWPFKSPFAIIVVCCNFTFLSLLISPRPDFLCTKNKAFYASWGTLLLLQLTLCLSLGSLYLSLLSLHKCFGLFRFSVASLYCVLGFTEQPLLLS